MKKKILSILLAVFMTISLLPTAAIAADRVESSTPCSVTENCTLPDEHDGKCVTVSEDIPKESVAETTDVPNEIPSAKPTAEKQLAALISALPAPSHIDSKNEEQVEAINNQLTAIYDFAKKNGIDIDDNETLNGVIAALYPINTTGKGAATFNVKSDSGSVTLHVNSSATDDNAARGNGATYKTINGAIDKAINGDTIKLMSAISPYSVLIDSKNLTIDFNGHQVTCGGQDYGINPYGTTKLTLIDSSESGNGGANVTRTQAACIQPEGTSTVTIEGGSYTSKMGYCVNAKTNYTGQVIINGGSFTATTSCVYNDSNAFWDSSKNAKIFLNDGVFKGNISGASSGVLLTPKVFDKVYKKNNLYNNIYFHFPSGKYKLTKDLDLHDWQLRVLEGEETTIDLNGFNITGNGMMNAPTEGGTVSLTNSDSLACLIQVHETGTLTVENSGQCDDTHGKIYNVDNGANIENVWNTFRNFGNLTLNGNLKVETLVGPPNPTHDNNSRPRSSQGSCVYLESFDPPSGSSVTLTVNKGVELHTKPTSSTAKINAFAIFPTIGYNTSSSASGVKVTINGGKLYGEKSAVQMSGTLDVNGGTFTSSHNVTECLYLGYPAAQIEKIENAHFEAKNMGLWIDDFVAQNNDISLKNTTMNASSNTPINIALVHKSNNRVIVSGKDTLWIANAILDTKNSTGILDIRAGVYSADPSLYVLDNDNNNIKDYAVLTLSDSPLRYLVAPWTEVGSDNKVSLCYPQSAPGTATASDTVDINAINDIEDIIPDPNFIQAKQFTLSSSADSYNPISGLTVKAFNGTKNNAKLTVEKTKATNVPEHKAYVWYGGKSVGEIVFDISTSYEVDVTGSEATTTGAGDYNTHNKVTVHAGQRNDYTFSGWTCDDASLVITNADKPDASFTMPQRSVTLTANWVRSKYPVTVNESQATTTGS
ncbi:MAG: hypothetical protein RSD18_07055, partial [Anaerovoracaceae bacterium]